MSTKERMKQFLSFKGTSEGKFEEATGLGTGFVSNMGTAPRKKTLEKIKSIYPDLNTTWLITGEGEMIKHEIRESEPTSRVLANLAESNKVLAEATKIQAEANRTQAEANKASAEAHFKLAKSNEDLVFMLKSAHPSTAGDPEEISLAVQERFSEMLELIADIGTGKRWKSRQEAIEELNKYVVLR